MEIWSVWSCLGFGRSLKACFGSLHPGRLRENQPNMKKSKSINIRVTEDFAALLKSEAERAGLSQSGLIEAAVNLFAKSGKVFTERDVDDAYDSGIRDGKRSAWAESRQKKPTNNG